MVIKFWQSELIFQIKRAKSICRKVISFWHFPVEISHFIAVCGRSECCQRAKGFDLTSDFNLSRQKNKTHLWILRKTNNKTNEACLLKSVSELKLTYPDAYTKIYNDMVYEWQQQYDQAAIIKGKKHHQIQPKVSTHPWFKNTNMNGMEIKIITRLRTDHGLCGKKKYLFKLERTDLCERCNKIDDLEHIIRLYPKCLSIWSKKHSYWIATRSQGRPLPEDSSILHGSQNGIFTVIELQ